MSVATSTRTLFCLEALQRLDARVLALVAVDRRGVDAVALELVGEAVGAVLGLAEDEHLLPVVGLDEVREELALPLRLDEVRPLRHRLGRRVAARHLDGGRVLQELRGELADLVGEGGREEQRLPRARDRVDDALDVRDEAHVEHAVGFVEHEDLHLAQVHGLLAHEVEQAPRRGDEDVDALAHLGDLRVDVDAAVDHEGLERDVLAVGLDALVDLDREFARRREDEAAHRVQRGREALARDRGEALQQGQGEAGRLAGARLGGAEQVAPGKDDGNGLRLDGGGFGVALFRDGAEQLGQKPETFESLADGYLLNDRPGRALTPSTGSGRQNLHRWKSAPGGLAEGLGGANRLKRLVNLGPALYGKKGSDPFFLVPDPAGEAVKSAGKGI